MKYSHAIILIQRSISHLTPAAAAAKPRSGFAVRPRRGELPVLVMDAVDYHLLLDSIYDCRRSR
jgi:hypothetical protein